MANAKVKVPSPSLFKADGNDFFLYTRSVALCVTGEHMALSLENHEVGIGKIRAFVPSSAVCGWWVGDRELHETEDRGTERSMKQTLGLTVLRGRPVHP